MKEITVPMAAKMLNKKPNTIYAALRTGKVPWGIGFKTCEENSQYSYIIYPAKFFEYVGFPEDFER